MFNKYIIILVIGILSFQTSVCQQLTGVWKGRINNNRVELKLVQTGDSITGTSYYHGLLNNFRRYSIKGYFDQDTNSVIWWDDQPISSKGANSSDKEWRSVADFNCPGGGKMYLDGKASPKDTKETDGVVSLTKVDKPSFKDEWDLVIDNYTQGGNDPDLIDSISRVAFAQKPAPEKQIKVKQPVATPIVTPAVVKTPTVQKTVETPVKIIKTPAKPVTIDEMFATRKKIFNREIPISGDSIELRFYDNAEVDGDSISLYLNNKIIFTHVRLTGKAYTIKLSVNELLHDNELVMVAENLGAIPPNTSYMVAIVGDKRFDAQLESTENSSCLIRLRKL